MENRVRRVFIRIQNNSDRSKVAGFAQSQSSFFRFPSTYRTGAFQQPNRRAKPRGHILTFDSAIWSRWAKPILKCGSGE